MGFLPPPPPAMEMQRIAANAQAGGMDGEDEGAAGNGARPKERTCPA